MIKFFQVLSVVIVFGVLACGKATEVGEMRSLESPEKPALSEMFELTSSKSCRKDTDCPTSYVCRTNRCVCI